MRQRRRFASPRSSGWSCALASLALLPAFSPLGGQDIAPREIAARAAPALVSITALADGEELRSGSGFLVTADGRLITNHHVVEGADEVRVELASGEVYDRVMLEGFDERRDLAILRIPGAGLPTLTLGKDRSVAVGDPVYVMGNPLGLVGTFSDGLISAQRLVNGTTLIQISAPISSGSSGGPVLDASGEVIGVATLTLRDGQNLNLAVPVRYAAGLLALEQEATPIGHVAWPRETRPSTAGTEASVDLEPWAQVLADEVALIEAAAEELGYIATHEAEIALINEGETYRVEFEFDEPLADVVIVAVCDGDCSDLDLVVNDEAGTAVGMDLEDDARPEVHFQVYSAATAEAVVRMTACAREPCAFWVNSMAR